VPNYTTQEAAAVLGIKSGTLHNRAQRLRKRMTIGRKQGGTWFYTAAEVRKIQKVGRLKGGAA